MPKKTIALRLSEDVIERVDEYVQRLGDETPGVAYTRSDAVRALLLRGLDVTESEVKTKRKR